MRLRLAVPTASDVGTLFDLRTSVREHHRSRTEPATIGAGPSAIRAAPADLATRREREAVGG